ncbi:transposase [Nocardia sp. NPDC005746]|uniref:RNA-guided endonuclease InsQ/TnpB family protein n=1 Tax=Nocardia sp. NPDC005746 TaxID=3157062 RepID=UPI00340916EB
MLANGRARILYASIAFRAGRRRVSVTAEAADVNLTSRHQPRAASDDTGWVGVDRGLSNFPVAATDDCTEVARVDNAPRPLRIGLTRQRRLAKLLSRKQRRSRNYQDAAARLARHHHRVANIRRPFLHQVTNKLVNTHDRLVIEDLNVAGMMANRRLARAIADTGWATFGQLLRYKQEWRGGTVVIADRWYPSSKRCSACTFVNQELTLSDRMFACRCGFRADRDHNAAAYLAAWPRIHPEFPSIDPRTPKRETGSPMPADEMALADTLRMPVKPPRMKREPRPTPRIWRGPTTPEKGGV